MVCRPGEEPSARTVTWTAWTFTVASARRSDARACRDVGFARPPAVSPQLSATKRGSALLSGAAIAPNVPPCLPATSAPG
jgi:hypothetical protein